MISIISIFALVLLVLAALAAIAVVVLIILAAVFTKAPFVPVGKKTIPRIVQALNIKPNSQVYDLGCGDARVLIAAWREQGQAEYFGLDKDWLPIICSWWKIFLVGRPKNITVLKRDFFKQDLSRATHIFVYLFPKLMDQLLPKLQAELKPGAKLVSCDFCFSNKKPAQVINLNRPRKSLGKKLFIYEF